MELNDVETYLKNNGGFASIKTLKKELNMNKKQVKRLIFNSTNLKTIDPLLVGSGKCFLPIFKYFEYHTNNNTLYYNRRRNELIHKR